jgi:hypothetical protein
MADASLKKVIVSGQQLPFLTFDTTFNQEEDRTEIEQLFYAIRYRVISEDRNRRSHWSPISKIPVPGLKEPFPYIAPSRFSISQSGSPEIITAVWSFPGDSENPTDYEKLFRDIGAYDVWVRWNENDTEDLNDPGWTPWEYEATVSSNSFSILKRDAAVERVNFAIQAPTSTKLRDYNNDKLTLFTGISGTIGTA